MMASSGRELTVLSTRAFLAGLEVKGLIESADEILTLVATRGRNVSRYDRNQPERDSKGNQITDWRLNLPDPSDQSIG